MTDSISSGSACAEAAQTQTDAEAILGIERAAFERWAQGDPTAFLEASDPEVDYFDPFIEMRLEGLPALSALYEPLRGTFQIERWEMINPRVIVSGDMGVLTFNFVAYREGQAARWNTTEVYRRTDGRWKIVHTHWALTQPQLVNPPV